MTGFRVFKYLAGTNEIGYGRGSFITEHTESDRKSRSKEGRKKGGKLKLGCSRTMGPFLFLFGFMNRDDDGNLVRPTSKLDGG